MASISSMLNPAPTSGSLNKGAIPATNVVSRKRGLPTTSSLLAPSLSTSVTEVQTNSTAAAPLFCRPFRKSFEKAYSEGDILFVKTEDVSAASRNKFHTVANLPVLNYLLRTTMEHDPGTGAPTKRKYRKGKLETVLKDWKFFGILLNDMDTSSQFQKLLNVTVRGRCRLPNYWSHDAGRALADRKLKKGQVVWLGFKLKTIESPTIMLNPDGSQEMVQATDPGVAPKVGIEEYYEAIPVLEPGEGGNKDFEQCDHCIPIAVIHQLPFKNTPLRRQFAARYVTDQGKLLDRMEGFVRI